MRHAGTCRHLDRIADAKAGSGLDGDGSNFATVQAHRDLGPAVLRCRLFDMLARHASGQGATDACDGTAMATTDRAASNTAQHRTCKSPDAGWAPATYRHITNIDYLSGLHECSPLR